ncbi:CRISPR-associated helicase Cas3' [Leptolyngbya sp. GB1-A1]|uniref:CRISPR-associated helicase Cas3' n=1 Tax=Leptolyngbya sp. GB1-A1 TaxID=2933908 RepID=UPI00329A6467
MNERFWAKTGRGEFTANGQPEYHPVICHLADTAAVARQIVQEYLSPAAIATLERGLGLAGEPLVKCCSFLAGCHDLGKVSPAFQFQVSEVGKALLGEHFYDLWTRLPDTKTPHGLVTAKTMPQFLCDIGLGNHLTQRKAHQLARRLAMIVGGHHGFFPSQADIDALDDGLCGTNPGSDWQHRRFSQTIFEQLQGFVDLTAADLPCHCDNAAAMILAGLTTVSDWVASNPDKKSGFPYANDTSFEDYTKELNVKAENALRAIGWTKITKDKPLDFTELFPKISTPRPLQNEAIALAPRLIPPCLILVEALMGEGKTETALYLADYLQHQTSAGGFYIGLPTQATSNAMWQRVKSFLSQRYSEETVNLTLSHAAAALKEEYQQTVCRLDQVYDEDSQNSAGRVGAGEWHTARKRSLLSPYGVGTVDQGLMGVVRSKHQFVRLFGLAGRTVILDEIHAYDLYTSTLLERLLEWLAVLGSPVIALSATLPTSTRHLLINAYARGCGQTDVELPQADYPRITTFSGGKVEVRSFAASKDVTRSLNLRWVSDGEWVTVLGDKLSEGGCAAVICSTVGRAQEIFERLQVEFAEDELGLFHGRFLFTNRERIENSCLKMFGKKSVQFFDFVKYLITSQTFPRSRAFITHLLDICARTRPYRYVLVATQVIEQSLDVDFDLMISDLAPIDLLLQRSGRLHRHIRDNRPVKLEVPTMWVVEPTINKEGKAQFADAGIIYNRHILLRSWLTLRNKNTVHLPAETDDLIESVYYLDAPIPHGLELSHQQDWESSLADYQAGETSKKIAQANAVKLPPALIENHPADFTRQGEEDDDNTIAKVTRLGEPTVTTIFLQQTANGLLLPGTNQAVDLEQSPNLATIRGLLEHSTRIGKRGLVQALMAQSNPTTWTSALLRYCRYVVLNTEGKTQVGKWELELDPLRGVVIEKVGR